MGLAEGGGEQNGQYEFIRICDCVVVARALYILWTGRRLYDYDPASQRDRVRDSTPQRSRRARRQCLSHGNTGCTQKRSLRRLR